MLTDLGREGGKGGTQDLTKDTRDTYWVLMRKEGLLGLMKIRIF